MQYLVFFHICLVLACLLSQVQLFATPKTIAHQAPLSMEFSRQEYWGGLPFPSAEGLPDPGFKHASSALVGGFFTNRATWGHIFA